MYRNAKIVDIIAVTFRTGAWIENRSGVTLRLNNTLYPTRMRELKLIGLKKKFGRILCGCVD